MTMPWFAGWSPDRACSTDRSLAAAADPPILGDFRGVS
jgi:hypothetical protein